jgi:hypothetical protein
MNQKYLREDFRNGKVLRMLIGKKFLLVCFQYCLRTGEKEQSTMQIDVKALYTTIPPVIPDIDSITKEVEHAKGLLHSLSSFIYSKGRFVTLPADEVCHFSSKDAFIFLCVTKSDEKPIPSQNTRSESITAELKRDRPDLSESLHNQEFLKESTIVHASRRPMSFILQAGDEIITDGRRESTGSSIRLSTVSRSSVSRQSETRRRLSHAARLNDTMSPLNDSQSKLSITGRTDSNPFDSPDSLASSTINLLASPRNRRSTISSTGPSASLISAEDVKSPGRDSRMDSVSQYQDSEFDDEEMNCTVYFWAGKNCAKLALLTFKFATLIEMQGLITDMYNCPLKVVYCEAEKEQVPFLACTGNEVIVHHDRSHKDGSNSIYRVWIDNQGTTRAIYHDVSQDYIQLLDERFVFLFKGFMWIGESSMGQSRAEKIAEKIRDVRFDGQPYSIVSQEYESLEFWEMIETHGVKQDLISSATSSTLLPSRDIILRTLRCSCSRGYFFVQELSSIVQCDLERDSCVIIDAGLEYGCYLWVGYISFH